MNDRVIKTNRRLVCGVTYKEVAYAELDGVSMLVSGGQIYSLPDGFENPPVGEKFNELYRPFDGVLLEELGKDDCFVEDGQSPDEHPELLYLEDWEDIESEYITCKMRIVAEAIGLEFALVLLFFLSLKMAADGGSPYFWVAAVALGLCLVVNFFHYTAICRSKVLWDCNGNWYHMGKNKTSLDGGLYKAL